MSKKFYESDKFQKLNKKWYKKLRKAGFDDIEVAKDHAGSHDNSFLKYTHTNLKYNMTLETYQITLLHYQNLRKFAEDAAFHSYFPSISSKLVRIYRKITELAGNGHSIAYISSHLRRYYKPPKHKLGRRGKPYSAFWVFTKLKDIKTQLTLFIAKEEEDDSELQSVAEFMESNRE